MKHPSRVKGKIQTGSPMPEIVQHLQSLIEQSALGLYRTTPDGRILYANNALIDMLGFTNADELTGRNLQTSGYAEPNARKEFISDIEKKGVIHARESVWTRKDGSTIVVIENATAIRNTEGKVLYYDGSAQDITAQRRMERDLQTSEERLRVVLKSLPIAIYTSPVDPTIDAIWISGNSESVTGYTAGEYIAEKDLWRRRLHPEDRDRVLTEFARGTTGREINVEYRWMIKNGSYRWFLDRSVIHTIDGGRDFIGVIVDITEQKEAEDLLRRSEERFRLISQSTDDLISVLDLNGRTVYRNPAYVKLLGMDAFTPGDDAFAHIHPDDRDSITGIFRETVATGLGKRAEYRFLARDGTSHIIESQGSVIRDTSGAIVNVVVVSRDVTESRHLEQQFLRIQRLESLGTLAGGVAHDLNNILSPILLSIHLIKNSVVSDEAQRLIRNMEASARRGSDIVRQILAFARGVDSEKSSVTLDRILAEIVPIIRETFPKNINVVDRVSARGCTIHGNATQIHQVLMNLCVNARDAMPEGGKLTISLENRSIDDGFARMYPEARMGNYVMISVEDTGIGIPESIIDRIFDPFFTTKETGKGTGLGLSTTHTIVRAHKGFVNVTSKQGSGTRFEVYLPLHAASATQPKTESVLQGHGELLLVCDGEESILQITRQSLELFGYRVLTSTDGDDALALYAANAGNIRAVISDTAMADSSGRNVIGEIERINPTVRIVRCHQPVNATGEPPPRRATSELDLEKPYTARALFNAIRAALLTGVQQSISIKERSDDATIRKAIVRPPGINFADGLTTVDLGKPDYQSALAQHEAYCKTLKACSVDVIQLAPEREYPDGTFVEDTAIVTPKGAIIARPGDPTRLGEIGSMRKVLVPLFSSTFAIEPPGTVDGGDICEAGDHFFIGISRRTNEHGARQLAAILRNMGYTSSFIDIRSIPGILHLKSGIAYTGDRRLIAWESLAHIEPFHEFDILRIPSGEEYAANCLRINDRMLIAAGFPQVQAMLEDQGYRVVPLEMSEFRKMDGGLSCLSLRF